MLSMPATADVSGNVSDAAFIAGQYCDDTWRALSKLAIAPGDLAVERAGHIANRLSAALGNGPWHVLVFSYPKLGWPVMALMGNRILVAKEFVDDSNDNELAFVYAHEMGHVALGHLPQRYAALIADAGGAVTRWTQVTRYAREEWALFRQEELEADQFGFALAARAGFDAKAGADSALSHLTPDPQHPTPEARLSALGLKGASR
ncbi:M48 family metalloprotease [Paraburkholderia rhynchosiae]|uniref:M48 family metalloprotease n=2 Tax=Paraburkholderia TaxID=1822464 RepID=A0ACC7NGU8_9BURK